MSQNRPFSQREIFLKTWLLWLLSFYYDLLCCKVSKIPKGTPWDVSLLIFGSRLGPNCFVSPKIICFEHFTSANIIYLLIPIMLQSFKKIVKPDPEIFVCVRFGQNLTKITHLPHKRIFWRFHLCDFNLHKNIQKKVLDIFRQAHRYTNNNKFFDLIITGQICSKKSVAIKIANFFFVSFLLSFSFVLLLTFLIFCLFFILHSLNKNKCRDNG